FEMKTPGIGLWAGLAALSGAGFLVAQFSLDLVESYELVLIALGLTLVIVEIMTMAGGGLLAAPGAVLAFAGLLLAFLPNELDFDLGDPIFLEALGDAAFGSVAAVAIVAVGFVLAITYLSRTSLTRRLALEGAVTATTAGEIEARADLVGRIAEAHEPLHPSGLVDVGGEMMSARAEHGSFISRGDAVEIIAVEFGEIVVRTHTPAPEADDGR
ncbi:MAG: NfeD family protein, partial [Rhodospirillales bacterium]|nr:NfeD family protein [Rhodospirillales bacterium]